MHLWIYMENNVEDIIIIIAGNNIRVGALFFSVLL